jgi:hypothetical protein
MHGAWCVGLIAGDNYVAVGGLQRVAQGEIDNLMPVFDSLLVALSLEFPITTLSSLQTGA